MDDLLKSALDRANELLRSRGYIYKYEVEAIYEEVLRETGYDLLDAMAYSKMEFIDFGIKKEAP